MPRREQGRKAGPEASCKSLDDPFLVLVTSESCLSSTNVVGAVHTRVFTSLSGILAVGDGGEVSTLVMKQLFLFCLKRVAKEVEWRGRRKATRKLTPICAGKPAENVIESAAFK